MIPGCIHLYCGNGKGKTTAALGLILRAAGRGKRVVLSRFLKDQDSGELTALRCIPGVSLYPDASVQGFLWEMTEKERQKVASEHTQRMTAVAREMQKGDTDLLVLDELLPALEQNLVPLQTVLHFLNEKPPRLEVVLTGREAPKELLELADYVSEIREIKHPFAKGQPPREGIEY